MTEIQQNCEGNNCKSLLISFVCLYLFLHIYALIFIISNRASNPDDHKVFIECITRNDYTSQTFLNLEKGYIIDTLVYFGSYHNCKKDHVPLQYVCAKHFIKIYTKYTIHSQIEKRETLKIDLTNYNITNAFSFKIIK